MIGGRVVSPSLVRYIYIIRFSVRGFSTSLQILTTSTRNLYVPPAHTLPMSDQTNLSSPAMSERSEIVPVRPKFPKFTKKRATDPKASDVNGAATTRPDGSTSPLTPLPESPAIQSVRQHFSKPLMTLTGC